MIIRVLSGRVTEIYEKVSGIINGYVEITALSLVLTVASDVLFELGVSLVTLC